MSYALRFSDYGQREFQLLDVWLQEEVLDVLDSIAAGVLEGQTGTEKCDFICEKDGLLHYVFLSVLFLRQEEVLLVYSVGTHTKPA